MKHDPAPALTRGIELIERLATDGACSLEQLARSQKWPKSSTLRLLKSLERAGVVARDPATKRYQALSRLTPIASAEQALRATSAQAMIELAEATRHTVELHQFEGSRVRMIDRSEPEAIEVWVRARIGFERRFDEIDALAQVALAFGVERARWPRTGGWYWDGADHRRPLGSEQLDAVVEEVRRREVAVDLGVNPNGVRRYAAPLLAAAGQLVGVLAVAESLSPRAREPSSLVERRLRSAALALSQRLGAAALARAR